MHNSHVIYQSQDELGQITVHEDGQYRLLSFAKGDEQSRISLSKPNVLQHEYTQAMMLSLLFCKPKRATVLGLGGGCLIRALLDTVPGIKLTAVELRPDVIRIAEKYFHLPRSKRLQILEQDAKTYITQKPDKKVDLLFTDLYLEEGMDKAVIAENFIEDCDKHLKNEGWLVINCWEEDHNYTNLIEVLRNYFIDIRSINTSSGNWVILAGKRINYQTAKALKQDAQKLSSDLDFQLGKWLNRLAEV